MRKILFSSLLSIFLVLAATTNSYADRSGLLQRLITRTSQSLARKLTNKLPALSTYVTDNKVTTPKPNQDFGWNEQPYVFVEFEHAKLNTKQSLYLTTTWTYEDAPMPSITYTQRIAGFSSNNGTLGTWTSPPNINWTPEPWSGELYHWTVTTTWANPESQYLMNIFPNLGAGGSLARRDSLASLLRARQLQIVTLGGVGTSTMKFTVNPEPVSSILFLTGGALLASRLRKKHK